MIKHKKQVGIFHNMEQLTLDYQKLLNEIYPKKDKLMAAQLLWKKMSKQSRRHKVDVWERLHKLSIKDAKGKEIVTGKEIIFQLRKHLATMQGNRCCYCRRWLQNVAHARPIEHVLPRKTYPQFSLHYWNMALSCRDCNHIKSANDWSGYKSKINKHPSPDSCAGYFHPRLHRYDSHIKFARIETNNTLFSIYVGMTTQGRALCRAHLKKVSAAESVFNNNQNISSSLRRLQIYSDQQLPQNTKMLGKFIDSLQQAMSQNLTVNK